MKRILLILLPLLVACTPEEERQIADDITDAVQEIEDAFNEANNDSAKCYKAYKTIGMTDINDAEIEIKMNAGVLQIGGDTDDLMYGGFAFSDPFWEPNVKFKILDQTGVLQVKQPSQEDINFNNHDRNVWNLRFNEAIPIEMTIFLGAGAGTVYARDLDITFLKITTGAGKTDIYLNNNWRHDVYVKITGGVGLTNVYLPERQGVLVKAKKGIGVVNYGSLNKSGNTYTNSAYETTDHLLKVEISTGLGAINLKTI